MRMPGPHPARLGRKVGRRHVGPQKITREMAPKNLGSPPAVGQVLKTGRHMHGHPARPSETVNWMYHKAQGGMDHPLFAKYRKK